MFKSREMNIYSQSNYRNTLINLFSEESYKQLLLQVKIQQMIDRETE